MIKQKLNQALNFLKSAKGKALSIMALAFGFMTTAFSSAHALADTDLAGAITLFDTYLADNKGAIITFVTGIFIVILTITLAKRAMGWGTRAIVGGAFGGGKRRR